MVDDLQNFGLVKTLHGLSGLVVVHQNNAALAQGNDVAAADHAAVFAFLIQHREIPVAHLGHDAGDVRHRGDEGEFDDIVSCHVIGDGRALAHQLTGGVAVAGNGHDGHARFLGDALDGTAHLGPVADDEERGLFLNGAELALVAVGQDHDVAFFHGAFQHFRGGGADLDMSRGADGVFVAHHHGAAQRLQNVLIARAALGQHPGIEHVHVGGGDILDRDEAQQLVVGVRDGQGVDLLVAHDLPGLAQAGTAVDAGHLTEIHVPDLGVDIGTHPGRCDPELFEHEFRLLVHAARAARLADQRAGLILELRIGNGRADGVGVRVAMPDDHDFVGCFWHGCSFPLVGCFNFLLRFVCACFARPLLHSGCRGADRRSLCIPF